MKSKMLMLVLLTILYNGCAMPIMVLESHGQDDNIHVTLAPEVRNEPINLVPWIIGTTILIIGVVLIKDE